MSFSQGISGLNAASKALDVIGNNIANSQTVGFKSSSVAFADIFAGATGLGVQVSGVNQDFTDGTLGMGNSALDMGIAGNGFFRLVDEAGRVMFSRNGQFKTDADGYIINNQGMYLTGYQASGTPPTIAEGASLGPIQIPQTQMPAGASTTGTLNGNLDSGSEAIAADVKFDPADAKTYSYTSQLDAYDSLGNKHTINVYYVKNDANKWTVYSYDTTAPQMDGQDKVYQSTTLEFNSSGQLITNPATLNVQSAAYQGAEALNLTLDLDGMTQQAADTAMNSPSTNGYPPGQINGYSVSDKGEIEASYSNGKKQLLGQVVLANFTNPGGLEPQGNNCWIATAQSGQPTVGVSGSGNLGTLYGGKLEASNVDLSQEMVNMIVYQRNYQSNAQTIQTQDQLLQTLVNMR